MPASTELVPGQRIGRCRVIRELGRGGMGAVWLAQHTTLHVPVAIKILPPHIARAVPSAADRFLREARLAARIRHACVMQVMDADRDADSGLHYIVLEYVDGGSVRDLLVDGGPLAPEVAVAITARVAQALEAAAAEHVVHRDIKPDNIMLTAAGDVKLADLGLAKRLTGADDIDVEITGSGAQMGTPAYMSPEQIESSRDVDARSDIYSLGATLWHMLAGRMPFTGDTPFRVMAQIVGSPPPDLQAERADVSDELNAVVARMMARAADDRYADATALREALEALPEYSPQTAIPAARERDPALLESVPMSPSGDATLPSGLAELAADGDDDHHPPTVPASPRVAGAATDEGVSADAHPATVPAAGRTPPVPGNDALATQESVRAPQTDAGATEADRPATDEPGRSVVEVVGAVVIVLAVVLLVVFLIATRPGRSSDDPQQDPPLRRHPDNRATNGTPGNRTDDPATDPQTFEELPAPVTFHAADPRVARSWHAHDVEVGALASGPHGRLLVSAGYRDRALLAWRIPDDPAADPTSEEVEPADDAHTPALLAHSGGRYWLRGLAGWAQVANRARLLRLNPDTGVAPTAETLATDISGTPVAFTPDERWLVTQYRSGLVHVYRMDWSADPPSAARVTRIGPPEGVMEPPTSDLPAAISPDGQLVATGARGATAALWRTDDVDTPGAGVALGAIGPPVDFPGLAFSRDSRWLVVVPPDGVAGFWPVRAETGFDGASEPAFRLAGTHALAAEFIDDRLLLTIGPGGDVILWLVSFDRGETARLATLRHPSDVTITVLSPDGARLAVGCADGTITLWHFDRIRADLGR